MKHKFAATETITFINKGAKRLYFYFGDSKTTPFTEANSILAEPGEAVVADAGKMGAPGKAYLFVYNSNDVAPGECEIDFK